MLDKGLFCLLPLLLCLATLAQAKQGSHFVTAAMRVHALANAQKYGWAGAAQKGARSGVQSTLCAPGQDLRDPTE